MSVPSELGEIGMSQGASPAVKGAAITVAPSGEVNLNIGGARKSLSECEIGHIAPYLKQ